MPSAFTEWTIDDVEQSIGQRFQAQVQRFPGRIAVRAGDDAWTYRELGERANQVAHSLLARRSDANEPVAILFDHGPGLHAAALGALEAAKIYVPLDPHDDAERHRGIISIANPVVMLCDAANADRAREIAQGREVIVAGVDTAEARTTDPAIRISPDTFAYIFFTSGSTGDPKGVVDNHRNVLHNILRYTNNLRITAEDRLTLLQSGAFSGSVSSLFAAVLNGASSHPFDLLRNGPARLGQWMDREGITIYHSVPSIFRHLARAGSRHDSVRVVRLEGDRASLRDVEIFRRHFNDSCELAVGLGATETGLSCQSVSGNGRPLPSGCVPIGIPPQHVDLRIVDDSGRSVEDGIAGELIVRSRFLAVGYWGRPDLTAAAFTDLGDGREREYRTGDIARIGRDGQVEYVGRKDHRLRIRGMSIDPSFVEQALVATGLVSEAVVGTRPNARGDERLIGWVVPASSSSPTLAELRRMLSGSLASWMIPSQIVALDAMPLSPAGKIDRGQLPDPPIHAGLGVSPQSPAERAIAGIWRDILKVDEIGIHDDFFEMGGDSLGAVQMAVEIEENVGFAFDPSRLLEAPTIAGIVHLIETKRGSPEAPSILCLQPEGRREPLFLLHPASGDVLLYRSLAIELGNERPVYALLPVPSPVDVRPSLSAIASQYVERVRAVQPEGPYHLGGFCFGANLAHEMARQLEAAGYHVAALLVLDTDGEGKLVSSARDAIMIHLRRLRRLRGRAVGGYLAERAGYRLDRVRVRSLALVARAGARFGRHLNGSVARARIRNAHFEASRSHVPAVWSGRVSYIQPCDRPYVDPSTFWCRIASRGIEVIEVPVTSESLFRQPAVSEVAKAINRVLDGAE